MSNRVELAADTNILMDAGKKDDAEDVSQTELHAARELAAQMLTSHVLVFSKKIQQEWQAKGLVPSNKLLQDLARLDRLKEVSPASLTRAQAQACGEYVDHDDQPFVLAARAINNNSKVLVTRDPKTTLAASRKYVKKTFSVVVRTASEFLKK